MCSYLAAAGADLTCAPSACATLFFRFPQRRCCLLFIVLAVLVVILAPTLLKTVGNA